MAEGTLGQETEDLPTSPLNRQPSVTLGVPGVPSSRVGAPCAPFMLALFWHECTYGHHIVRKKKNRLCKKPHSPQQKLPSGLLSVNTQKTGCSWFGTSVMCPVSESATHDSVQTYVCRHSH